MQPSEIRACILEEHSALRAQLGRVQEWTARAERRETRAGYRFVELARSLLEALLRHLDHEDRVLVPALRDADLWGDLRAERVVEEHREHRREARALLARLAPQGAPDPDAVRAFDRFGEALLEDMAAEERTSLDPRVLRDDVIAIDADSG